MPQCLESKRMNKLKEKTESEKNLFPHKSIMLCYKETAF